ncbi:MAG: hypothetical protein IKM55_00180, partial [Bacilli bacterium]|nr:hypothetical protein [Bacilli bacterium]
SELSENRENDSNIKIMKYLLEERVKQDPKFEELLKATGNLELTHIRDNTIWKEKFPQLLMEIRDNLNNKNEQGQTTPKQGDSKPNIGFTLTQKTPYTNKDQLKANEANAYIGYGVVNSSTYTYMKDAEKAGIPVNENINPDKNTKAFVSVNGGKRENIEKNRQRALDTAIKVLEAGGQIIMDNTSNANSDWNKNGEGWVQNELKNRGYVVKEGKDFNTFSKNTVTTQNTQTSQQENNDTTQDLSKEANNNNTKDSSKDTDTSNTPKNTTNINNVKDFHDFTAGVEMDSTFENSDIDTQENNDKSIAARIINKANRIIELAMTKLWGKDGVIAKTKEESRQNELKDRLLNLNEILKPKDNPKSLLGDLNDARIKEITKRINIALGSTFGLKNKLNIRPFLTYFGALSTTNFLMSKELDYKSINNTSTLFSNDNVKYSATIRALEALTDYRFSYTNYRDLKEVSPNLKSMREIPSGDLDFLLRGVPLSTLARDIGKKILSDVGLEVNESKATLSDANRIYQELGIA